MISLLWFLVACEPKAAPVSSPLSAVPVTDTAPTPKMDRHFAYALAAQQAVIDGDLRAANHEAAALAKLPAPEGFDPKWAAEFETIQARSAVIATATDLTQAASAVASLGLACGGCHARESEGPRAPLEEINGSHDQPRDAMHRHQMGANWMWLGLVGADPAAYDAGVRLLAEPAAWDPSDSRSFTAMQTQIVVLSQVADGDRSAEKRAAIYGDVLGTCAACHQRHRKAD